MGIAAFASRVSRAQNIGELAPCLLDDSGDLADAPIRGLYVFAPDRLEIHVRRVPEGSVELYERFGRAHDPVLTAVHASHQPSQISFREMHAYSRDPSLPDDFRAFVDRAMRIASEGQYLAAPLVVGGEIAGTINLARGVDAPVSPAHAMTAFAMALHVSSRLAALRALELGVDPAWDDVLTPRGCEVAELAARGLTMHEIGRALGVSANTAKKHLRVVYDRLGIATRAELATMLAKAAFSPLPSRGASRAR